MVTDHHVGAGKLNLRNLEEYHVLSATEQSLQPLEFYVLNWIELSASHETGSCLYSAPHTRPWPLECAQLQRGCSAPVLLWLHQWATFADTEGGLSSPPNQASLSSQSNAVT